MPLTPLDVADIFRRQLEGSPRAWIFTSATLAVGADFSNDPSKLSAEEQERRVKMLYNQRARPVVLDA